MYSFWYLSSEASFRTKHWLQILKGLSLYAILQKQRGRGKEMVTECGYSFCTYFMKNKKVLPSSLVSWAHVPCQNIRNPENRTAWSGLSLTPKEGLHLGVGKQTTQSRPLTVDAASNDYTAWHFQIIPFKTEASFSWPVVMVSLTCQHGKATVPVAQTLV